MFLHFMYENFYTCRDDLIVTIHKKQILALRIINGSISCSPKANIIRMLDDTDILSSWMIFNNSMDNVHGIILPFIVYY